MCLSAWHVSRCSQNAHLHLSVLPITGDLTVFIKVSTDGMIHRKHVASFQSSNLESHLLIEFSQLLGNSSSGRHSLISSGSSVRFPNILIGQARYEGSIFSSQSALECCKARIAVHGISIPRKVYTS